MSEREDFLKALQSIAPPEEPAIETPAEPPVNTTPSDPPVSEPVTTLATEPVVTATGSVVTEPVTDPPADPPVKNLADFFAKPKAVEPEPPAAPQAELPKEIQDDLKLAAEYKELIKKAEEGNPLYQALKYSVTPDKLVELIKEVIPTDYSNHTLEQLVHMNIDQKAKGKLTAEEIKLKSESILEKLDDTDKKLMQIELQDKFTQTALKNESKVLKEYKSIYEQSQAAQPKPISPEQMAQIEKADTQAMDTVFSQYEGGEFFGFKFDKTVEDAIREDFRQISQTPEIGAYVNKDNTLNAEKLVNDRFFKLFGSKIAETAYEQGKKDALKGHVFPKNSVQGTTNVTEKTKEEKILEAGENMRKKAGL